MAKMKKSVTGTSPIWQVCTYAVLLLVVLVAVFPAIWMLSTSIKLPTEQYDIPPAWRYLMDQTYYAVVDVRRIGIWQVS